MKASVIIAHPYSSSFNHAIYKRIISVLEAEGVEVFCHDLYEEGFNPVMTVGELMDSALLFFVHPNWWGQPPAILKGYVDRVIRPPYAYDMPEGALSGLPVAKLNGKYGIVYNTSNTEAERENGYFGDPLENIWKQCTFGFCGVEKFHRRMFRIVSESTDEVRKNWLMQVETDIKQILSESAV